MSDVKKVEALEQGASAYRKICIVGFSESTRDDVPWDDPTLELWGMNTLWEWLPAQLDEKQRAEFVQKRFSRWYDLHGLEVYDLIPGKRDKQTAWLKQTKIPVWMNQAYEEFPTSKAYPFKEMERRFFSDNPLAKRINGNGEFPENPYFTNSVVQEICHAIVEQVNEIHIYGIDMVKDSEWGYQRPNCEYFIGLARGMGIKVVLPEKAALCRGMWKYGVDDKIPEYHKETLSYFQNREKELHEQRSKWDHERDKAIANFWAHDGAIQENRLYQELFRDRSRGAVLWRGEKK